MAHETVAGIEGSAAGGLDDIDERFHNARDERIQALTLAMLEGITARIAAGETPSEILRATAVKAMLSRASKEAFDLLVAEDAAAEAAAGGVCNPVPALVPWRDTFDQWEGEQPNRTL